VRQAGQSLVVRVIHDVVRADVHGLATGVDEQHVVMAELVHAGLNDDTTVGARADTTAKFPLHYVARCDCLSHHIYT